MDKTGLAVNLVLNGICLFISIRLIIRDCLLYTYRKPINYFIRIIIDAALCYLCIRYKNNYYGISFTVLLAELAQGVFKIFGGKNIVCFIVSIVRTVKNKQNNPPEARSGIDHSTPNPDVNAVIRGVENDRR